MDIGIVKLYLICHPYALFCKSYYNIVCWINTVN